MDEKSGVMEIDIKKLAFFCLRRWWVILIATVLVAMGAYAYARYEVPIKYRAVTTIFVNNFESDTEYTTVSGVSYSGRLVNTYITILTSNRVLDKVVVLLDGDYTAAQIKPMVSAARVSDTEILAVYITGPIPEETARIANVMGLVVMEELTKIIEGSSARVLDTAVVPTKRYSPNYRSYAVKGAAAGAAAAIAILALLFFLDVRIKDEDDLTELFDVPILGQIPEFTISEKSGYTRKNRQGQNAYDPAQRGGGTGDEVAEKK